MDHEIVPWSESYSYDHTPESNSYDHTSPPAVAITHAHARRVRRCIRHRVHEASPRTLVERLDRAQREQLALLEHARLLLAQRADRAVQVHFGQGRDPVWHNDGVNSVLHMALSVHGNRTLRTLLRAGADASRCPAFRGRRTRPHDRATRRRRDI